MKFREIMKYKILHRKRGLYQPGTVEAGFELT
jgi:hypothetical protein